MKRLMRAMLFIAMLAGCGGGESNPPTAATVSGVTAAGAPLAGTVILKDSSSTSKELSTSLALDGSYSFNVVGLTAPFLLQATGTAGVNNYTLYSLSSTSGNCNINPLTHLAVTMANGGQELTGVFAAPRPSKISALNTALPSAVASIHNKLAPMFNQVGASPVSVMTDRIAANGQGVDLLFDMVSITTSNGSVSIVNKADGGTILPSTSLASGALSENPNIRMMSSVFSITGSVGSPGIVGSVSARNKALPYLVAPVITVPTDAHASYKLLVPNGTYEICGSTTIVDGSTCINLLVSNGNIAEIDFPRPGTYVPGELLVIFKKTATLADLNNFIRNYGLQWNHEPQISTNQSFAPWGIVKVPIGAELKWIGTLKIDQLVVSAGLNEIITIDEPIVVAIP